MICSLSWVQIALGDSIGDCNYVENDFSTRESTIKAMKRGGDDGKSAHDKKFMDTSARLSAKVRGGVINEHAESTRALASSKIGPSGLFEIPTPWMLS